MIITSSTGLPKSSVEMDARELRTVIALIGPHIGKTLEGDVFYARPEAAYEELASAIAEHRALTGGSR